MKKLDDAERLDPKITFRLKAAEKDKFKKLCQASNIKPGIKIREMVMEYSQISGSEDIVLCSQEAPL